MTRMLSVFCLAMLALTSADIFAADLPIKQFQAGDVISAADVNGNFQALSAAVQQLQTRITELETHDRTVTKENQDLKTIIATLQTKIAALEKQMAALSKGTSPPATSAKTPKYRSQPKTVSSDAEAMKVFGLDKQMRPLKQIENNFEVQGDVVIDYATGLMWQKAGSLKEVGYNDAQKYIRQLNQQRFSGFTNWRMPTIDELLSLIETNKHAHKLYIDPVFDEHQSWCWSADISSAHAAWHVYFHLGQVAQHALTYQYFVRAVRSL